MTSSDANNYHCKRLLPFLTCLVSLGLLACDPAKQSEPSRSSSDASRDSKPESAATPDPTAYPPVSVGGAFLSCLPSPDGATEVRCVATDEAGRASDFQVTRAFVVSGKPLQWTDINFESDGLGSWRIDRQQSLRGSFAVLLQNAKGEVLADWIIDAEQPPLNLMLDGSFEDRKLLASDYDRQFVPGTEQGAWKARVNAGAACPISILEIQSNLILKSEPIAAEGHQWLELDSQCNDPEVGSNAPVYQDVKIEAGHLYQLSFAYKRQAADKSVERFRFKFGDEAGSELFVGLDATAWHTFKVLKMAAADNVSIEFEELGLADGVGALIDDVRLLDLGPADRLLDVWRNPQDKR